MSKNKKTNFKFSKNVPEDEKKFNTGLIKDILYISILFIIFLFNIIIVSKLNLLDSKVIKLERNSKEKVSNQEDVIEKSFEKAKVKEETEPVTENKKSNEAPVLDVDVNLSKVGEGKNVYLTFDDGPSRNTRIVLDILDKYNIKATFFCVMTEGDEDLYKEIVDRGHTIAIHSKSHDYSIVYNDMDSFIDDVMGMREYIYEITGVYTNIYRFPGGSASTVGYLDRGDCIRYLNAQGIHYFDWNVSSGDASSDYISPDEIIENVYTTLGIYDNSVILMHDSLYKTSTMVALDELIERIIADGYTFKAIDMDTEPVQQILSTNY